MVAWLLRTSSVAFAMQGSCMALLTRHVVTMTVKDSTKFDIESILSTGKNKFDPYKVQCVLCDIDGTFVSDDHKVSEDTVETIKALVARGIKFFPATGRTRTSVAGITGSSITGIFQSPLKEIPGVYAQGLTVYGPKGSLIYERFLEPSVIAETVAFCDREGLAVIAYAGEKILCRKKCMQTNKIINYCEPAPDEFPKGLEHLHATGVRVNKLIILEEEEKIVKIRPNAEYTLGKAATLTRATPGMLEILPKGASKGDGVLRLLNHYGIDPQWTVAFGDGENDLEMFQNVGLGIAMGNAKPGLKDVAIAITKSNNENGVGVALKQLLNALDQPRAS